MLYPIIIRIVTTGNAYDSHDSERLVSGILYKKFHYRGKTFRYRGETAYRGLPMFTDLHKMPVMQTTLTLSRQVEGAGSIRTGGTHFHKYYDGMLITEDHVDTHSQCDMSRWWGHDRYFASCC